MLFTVRDPPDDRELAAADDPEAARSAARKERRVEAWTRWAWAGTTATACLAMTHPLGVARARLAADVTPRADAARRLFRGPTDALHVAGKREGWRGPWRGLGASLLHLAPHWAAQTAIYTSLTERLPADTADRAQWWFPWAKLGCAAAASTASAAVAHPLDTLATRAMVAGGLGFRELPPVMPGGRPGRGTLGALRSLRVDWGGPGVARGLYRGFLPAVLRAAPASTLHLIAYDLFRTGAVLAAPGTAAAI